MKFMKYYIQWIVLVAILSPLLGCGLFSDDDPYAYRHARSGKPLKMPEGLSQPEHKVEADIPEPPSAPAGSIDELEQPPEIVKSVDLKELDTSGEAKPDQAAKVADNASKQQPTVVLDITSTKDSDGNSLLLVKNKFDTVWPRVKPALEELGFKIDDASRGQELYTISKTLPRFEMSNEPVHPADEKPEVKEEFQIHVTPKDGGTEITVHNKYGQREGSGLADHLLLQIKELMENPKPNAGG